MAKFLAEINNEIEVAEVFETGRERSTHGYDTFIMSNGKTIILTQEDYLDEWREDGYWVAVIFSDGNKCDI